MAVCIKPRSTVIGKLSEEQNWEACICQAMSEKDSLLPLSNVMFRNCSRKGVRKDVIAQEDRKKKILWLRRSKNCEASLLDGAGV